ncbi:MAG: M20 family metallopeptidase [Bryobacterales bacterium]|nr:M20 family metallopeptidase [Bryobacterales bacterium]
MSGVLETLADLVRIPSINPAYEGGVPEEAAAAYVERFFAARGIETWRQEVFPGRPNLIARLPGSSPGLRVVLEAHTDTVSVGGMTIPPFEPEVRDGNLYGRGSCDTKAGLAAMMHAVAGLHADGIVPQAEVWLVAAADEEHSFRGVLKLCEALDSASAAIVAEPTSLRAVIASKGVVRWKIRTRGRSAHSSKPHLGINAISHMARVIDLLEREAPALAPPPHPLLGPATLNIGIIRGGAQVNFVPAECEIEIDRRLLPGERTEGVLAEYDRLLDRLRPEIDVVMDVPMLADEALETPASSAVAAVASRVLERLGLDPEPCGVPYGSDASKLSRHGVPSMIFGPGSIDRAHAAVEFVECDQVLQAERFFREFLLEFGK